jgi:hypothetical protein
MFYQNNKFRFTNDSIFLGGIIVFISALFFYLTFFIHPSGDDFTYAFLELKSPFFKAYFDEYFLWNGRFTSNFFVLKNPLTFGFNNIWLYRVVVFCLQFLLLTSIFLILNLVKSFFNLKSRIFISFFLFLSYLLLIPALNEGFYWYTGLVTYQLAIILSLLYLYSLFFRFSVLRIFFIIFLQACIIGLNEVVILYLIIFHFLIFLFYSKHPKKKYFILLSFTSIIFGLIVYLAPGNSIRESYFQNKSHHFLFSFYMSFLQTLRFSLVLNSGFLLFVSAFVFYFKISTFQYFIDLNSKKVFFFIIPLFIFSALFISVFPAYWTTGIMGQHRTVNFAFFICIPLLFYWYLLIINKFKIFFNKLYLYLRKFSILIFLLSMLLTKNLIGIVSDIKDHKEFKFNNENFDRYINMENQLKYKKKDVFLSKLKTHPFSIFIYDLEKDPNQLVNIGYQRYWKIPGKVYLNP